MRRLVALLAGVVLLTGCSTEIAGTAGMPGPAVGPVVSKYDLQQRLVGAMLTEPELTQAGLHWLQEPLPFIESQNSRYKFIYDCPSHLPSDVAIQAAEYATATSGNFDHGTYLYVMTASYRGPSGPTAVAQGRALSGCIGLPGATKVTLPPLNGADEQAAFCGDDVGFSGFHRVCVLLLGRQNAATVAAYSVSDKNRAIPPTQMETDLPRVAQLLATALTRA
ncbi:hypothetical protein GCM10017786_70930 [Amycolatopsis deserti]|uniref:DUF5642 domain-containing protein n=1 Tax=Amycolatopsis deserti TaxID=185696 RepID=A0ABQ3JK09_9PSEU|nr:hypothetical protein [Amycolatopsis deserti]GHF26572.1 hypothetical protein GCM10017786_70930 [Amycolatopsis deserti]